MNIGTQARGLAAALVLGAAIVGLSVDSAEAAPKDPKDNGERCSLDGETVVPPSENDYEFYVPGDHELALDANGKQRMLQCQKDGTWKDVTPAPKPSSDGRTAPQSGAVISR
jgi:hypothetical protein